MLRPKFITFDCYGTLTDMLFSSMAREVYADRVVAGAPMDAFISAFAGYRLDEVLGPWKPYRDVIAHAVERACRRFGIPFDATEAERFYEAVPTWRPHADVPAGIKRLAAEFPLVGLTNAMESQIMRNVGMYGAQFHRIITAERVQSYKPRMHGFEVMMEELGARPEELLHVSSSFRYDLMTAHDLGIQNKIWVNRGHEPANPFYEYHEVSGIDDIPALLGL